ncbi:MAG: hypothetical protein GXP49_11945 [Deltaproteobacteria bacterium]|nr:hypothetical protein [Deltaproteobacteria bacterium]
MARMTPVPRCMATMIGSMPHKDPGNALDLVFENLKEAPIWPELPRRSFMEGFVAAHVDGMPGIVINREREKIYVDLELPNLADQMTRYYEKVMAAEESGDLSGFAIDEEHASGLAAALARLEKKPLRFPFFKTHCIGPVSMQLQLEDRNERPVYYSEGYQDVVVRQVSLQSRWAVRRFRPFGDMIIAFLDEPALAAFGSSAYLGVMKEDVVERFSSAVSAVHLEGAVAGVHVCGNTDWAMMLDTGVDIINYDAYAYSESILVYAGHVRRFMEDGGVLAWGIVPTSVDIRTENGETLSKKLKGLMSELCSKGSMDMELVLRQSMVTPSCGMGTMSVEDTKRVVETLVDLAERMQKLARPA